jgi:hypothetical protein
MEALIAVVAIFFGIVVVMALLAVFIAFSSMYNGWVLMKLWEWFIIPVFHLPMLTLPAAMGLSLVVHFLTYQHQSTSDTKGTEEEEKKKRIRIFVQIFLRPLIVLGIGYVIHLYM